MSASLDASCDLDRFSQDEVEALQGDGREEMFLSDDMKDGERGRRG